MSGTATDKGHATVPVSPEFDATWIRRNTMSRSPHAGDTAGELSNRPSRESDILSSRLRVLRPNRCARSVHGHGAGSFQRSELADGERFAGHASRPPVGASRVASLSLVHTCHRHYPGRTAGCACRSPSPATAAFPRNSGGSAPALPFSRPAQRSLLVTACMLAESLTDPLHWKLQPLRYLHDRSNCYRLERQLPGGNLTH